MTFDVAVEIIIEKEGGEKITEGGPNDPGGVTKFGISQRSYPNLDIRNLTKEQAIEIYYRDFWDKLDLHLLPPYLRLTVFDCAVNQGQPTSVRLLKQCLGHKNSAKFNEEDFTTIGDLGKKKTLRAFTKARKARYLESKNFKVNGGGWLGRLLEITLITVLDEEF